MNKLNVKKYEQNCNILIYKFKHVVFLLTQFLKIKIFAFKFSIKSDRMLVKSFKYSFSFFFESLILIVKHAQRRFLSF